MPLHPDWKEFLELLNSNGVDYLIVGAHARGFYGTPRYTGDLDILVKSTPANASRIESVLSQFGFASLQLRAKDFLARDQIIQPGVEPYRSDLLTSISGVEFEDAWADRACGTLDGVPVAFLSLRALRKNKLAAGRAKDLADLEDLPLE